MSKENIFIHIPKTGGTTINTAMNNTYWATKPDFYYRHIRNETKTSNSADIFDPGNFEKYSSYNIFMMLRDPVDRLVSEYYFLKERKEFINLLCPQPNNFKEYINNSQTQNYMTGFLLGKRIYDKKSVTEEDLDMVLKAIDALPIHVGIFEQYPESLSYFEQVTGIQWSKKLEAKRVTFNRPEKENIGEELKSLILETNQLDKKLYDHCLLSFKEKIREIPKRRISIVKDKYNHIIPFTARTCLFEFCMQNKYYLKQNLVYFRDLTFYLHKDMQIRNGKEFVRIWNTTFVNSIKMNFPNSPFYEAVQASYSSKSEPLQQTIGIAQAVDRFFENKQNKKYYKQLKFDRNSVVRPKEEGKGLFKKLFGLGS